MPAALADLVAHCHQRLGLPGFPDFPGARGIALAEGGYTVVRLQTSFDPAPPSPDDLLALVDAVREAARNEPSRTTHTAARRSPDRGPFATAVAEASEESPLDPESPYARRRAQFRARRAAWSTRSAMGLYCTSTAPPSFSSCGACDQESNQTMSFLMVSSLAKARAWPSGVDSTS